MSNDAAIKVEHVSKTFKLPHERAGSIKNVLVNFSRRKKGYEKQHVLDDISFEIKKGEFFGIVGRNGSGKSTLLKLLAGIYTPDKGQIEINGKLTPFIELGVGFNPELTGRENVFLNGALLGFNRKEMLAMYDEIVEFAELERFMDQKLKNYSSGMQVRLAFSIAIRANTEILVLDEVLAVGDAAFQQKCNDYFEKLKQNNKTIILVTHDMNAVTRFCTKALLIENGVIKLLGSPDTISTQYTLDNMNTQSPDGGDDKLSPEVKSLTIVPTSAPKLTSNQEYVFEITYELNEEIPIYLGLSLITNGIAIMDHNSRAYALEYSSGKKHTVRYKLPLKYLNSQKFSINVSIFKEKNQELMGYKTNACEFLVHDSDTDKTKGGPVKISGAWSKVTRGKKS